MVDSGRHQSITALTMRRAVPVPRCRHRPRRWPPRRRHHMASRRRRILHLRLAHSPRRDATASTSRARSTSSLRSLPWGATTLDHRYTTQISPPPRDQRSTCLPRTFAARRSWRGVVTRGGVVAMEGEGVRLIPVGRP